MTDTLDHLDRATQEGDELDRRLSEILQSDEPEAALALIDRQPHKKLTQEQIVLWLLDRPDKVDLSLISPLDFDVPECQAIVTAICDYWQAHKIAPTRRSIKAIVERKLTEDDPWYAKCQKLLNTELDPRETPGIVAYLKDWQLEQIDKLMRLPGSNIEDCFRRKAALTNPPTQRFNFRSLADLIKNKRVITYLVDQVLSDGQPFMLFGPKKSLKTAFLCDLAISLTTATPFLGRFDVPVPVNVGYFSAESGEDELIDRMECIQKAKGINSIENLKISFESPRLSNAEDVAAIAEFVGREKIGVMIVDPAYLTMLSGSTEISASNLMQMGPLLGNVTRAIKDNGGVPILCHHTRKTVARLTDLDLDDMSFSGFAEFARQSLAVWRREEMAGINCNRLTIKTHGYKRAACFDVDVDETTWGVSVIERELAVKQQGRDRADYQKGRVLMAIQSLEEQQGEKGVSVRALNTLTGINGTALKKALQDLAADGAVSLLISGGKPKWTRTATVSCQGDTRHDTGDD